MVLWRRVVSGLANASGTRFLITAKVARVEAGERLRPQLLDQIRQSSGVNAGERFRRHLLELSRSG